MKTAYWNDYYLKRKGKSSIESKDLSAACESFNSGNEINRKLKKSQVFTFKRTQFQDISHQNSNSLHKVNSRQYFDESANRCSIRHLKVSEVLNSRVSINNTHSLKHKVRSFWSLLINTTSVCPIMCQRTQKWAMSCCSKLHVDTTQTDTSQFLDIATCTTIEVANEKAFVRIDCCADA